MYASVPDDGWQRTAAQGRAADGSGSEFTVESIGRYHLHDVVHHLWDVTITPARGPQEW